MLKHQLYTDFMHGIDEVTTDRLYAGGHHIRNRQLLGDADLRKKLEGGRGDVFLNRERSRISLTIRNVLKTSKVIFRT